MTDSQTVGRILALSALEGTRTMTTPALMCFYFSRNPNAGPHWLTRRAGSTAAVLSFATFALGELVADKLPFTPARTEPAVLIGRTLLGGGLGTLLARAYDQPTWLGTIGGAIAATATTYAAYYLRRELGRILHVPDSVLALLEDGTVITTSWQILAALDQTWDAKA